MSKTTRLLSTSAYGGVEYGNQLIDHFGTITPPSPEQTARARRYAAGMATDVEDAKVAAGDARAGGVVSTPCSGLSWLVGVGLTDTAIASLHRRLSAGAQREGACLVWRGAKRGRYGAVGVWAGGRSVALGTHRVAYALAHGPIPAGLWIDHLCRNTLCIEPDHLEAVTPGENTRRGWEVRRSDQCREGHRFTPENTRINHRGDRRCRTCERLQIQLLRAKESR